MKLINKQQISHIVVFTAREGFKVLGDCFWKYTHYDDEYFKLLWLFPIKTLDKGFYRNGKKDSWCKINDDYFDKKKHYLVLNEVYTHFHIDIYSAGQKIHTEYFEDYDDLEKHIEEHYKDFDIRYGNV